jgi:hypothetical protein
VESVRPVWHCPSDPSRMIDERWNPTSPVELADVLPSEQFRARAHHLRDRARDDTPGRVRWQPAARACRDAARAVRRPAGGAARTRGAHSRLRPHDGRGPLRSAARGGGRGRERDRHDVPAGADVTGAHALVVSRGAEALHGRRDPLLRGRPRQRGGAPGNRRGGAPPAHALGLGRRGARRFAPPRARRGSTSRRSTR